MTSDPRPAAPDGRRRLAGALRSPGSRGQVVVGALLAVLGFAAVVQVQATGADDDFAGARQADLIALINSLSQATDRAKSDIADLEQTRSALLDQSDATRTAVELARQQVETLGILAGTVSATGPGVRITVKPASQDRGGGAGIGTDQLLDGLQELRDAGAEAIEVNDRVRVVAQTGIQDSSHGLVVGGVTLHPPYTLDVIGDRETLATAVDFQGGFADSVAQVGGRLTVDPEQVVEVTSVRRAPGLRFARPVPPKDSGDTQGVE